MKAGIDIITEERARHFSVEGWTNDNTYINQELAYAAMSYVNPKNSVNRWPNDSYPPTFWPWTSHWWKPGDRKRELAKAGALIAAEIDRILEEEKNVLA